MSRPDVANTTRLDCRCPPLTLSTPSLSLRPCLNSCRHYPGFVEGYVSLRGRVDVQEWACTGPIAGHPTVVLAGEAVSANWGWVEGAVQTAQLAARTLNQRLSGKEGEQ